MKKIILFDGECNLCNGSVQFIIKRDHQNVFQFASLQSKTGMKLKNKHYIKKEIDSIILIEGDRIYTESTAALRITRELTGFWKLLFVFWIIPYPLRNSVYRFIARNRYKWFGKQDSCMIPTKELKDKFLD